MSVQMLPFLDVFKDASGGNLKTPQTEFLQEGEIPVVDQGQALVAGFINDRARICKAKPPVIVFGDHTRAIKYVDFEFAMGADGTKVLVPKVESDTKYLYYALKAIEIPSAGYSRHYKFLKETQIPLPPLAEQKRIAGILDAADALRAKRRESLVQLDTLLQSTFLDMFGDPVTNPMEWEKNQLGEISDKITDGEHLNPEFSSSGMPIVMAGNVLETGVDLENAKRVEPALGERFRRKCGPEKSDILLVSRGATIGRMCVVNTDQDFCLMGSVILVKVRKSSTDPAFLSGLLKHPATRRALYRTSGSSAQQAIYIKDVRKLGCMVPPLDLQRRYAAIVESVEQQKTRQRVHLAELDTLFASLQTRAFRGDL